METEVGIEESDEAKFEERGAAKTSSAVSLPEHTTDPVVYQLVRVEGDGRLVPATDDEVMEVEDLHDDERNEIQLVTDTGQTVRCVSGKGIHPEKALLKESEVLPQSESQEVVAGHSNAIALEKLNAEVEESFPTSVPTINNSPVTEPESTMEGLNDPSGLIENGSSSSCQSASWMPDFSKLQGEICLDKLSVRELHETFKATFGRETFVKDKQWLKRRIAMGLTNSCDISAMTFVIKDNGVVKKGERELQRDPVVGATNEDCGGLSACQNNSMENPSSASDSRIQTSSLDYNYVSDHLNMEQKAAKRLRKPTKRYIEELSVVESREHSKKSVPAVKSSIQGQSFPGPVGLAQNVKSDGMHRVMRQDSLGGSGVQVPYVSRVRRCRPRQNITSLLKLQPSGMGMTAKLVERALSVRSPHLDNDRENILSKPRLDAGWTQQPNIVEPKKEVHNSETKTDLELNQMKLFDNTSDDKVRTMPSAKGGMRRKHHRPWTLGEVVKLVEGVARYGAGRWSEIKRLAFASYEYRTSVDLKDKWRNLIKSSFTQLPTEEVMQNSRKQTSIHIPAPILSRVRELAEIQAHVPASLGPNKFVSYSRSVHETRSGYL